MKFLDFLYNINSPLSADNTIWEKLKIKKIARIGVKISANYILPFVFKLTKQKIDAITTGHNLPVIVSLTSFPQRIGKVWLTIESILRQKSKPEKIILWLSKDQFPKEELDLPKNLIKQKSRGLTIKFVEGNIRSHKKYYYVFNEFPRYKIITIDDDLLFPSYFIGQLFEESLLHPKCVISSFGSKFHWNEKEGYITHIPGGARKGDSGANFLFGSGGGTLFQPKYFIDKLDEIEDIIKLCPTADDIYLNAITRLVGFYPYFIQNKPLLSIINSNDTKLFDENGQFTDPNSKNAEQLKKVVKYFNSHYNLNPFENN